MKTYAIRGARTKTTGHIRQDGTRTTYCNRPVGMPNGDFLALKGWKMCTRCVTAEARDRNHAEEVAAQHAEPISPDDQAAALLPIAEQVAANSAALADDMATTADRLAAAVARADAFLATRRVRPTAADRAAADTEAREAAELVTEAEATEGTWRGSWIGDTTALFDRPIEQGSLFA